MTSLSKREMAVLEIERRILGGELRAGERLPTEDQLGEQLGYSRTVIRDALRVLAARRLITVRHGFGIEVAAPSDLPFAHALADLLMRTDVTLGEALEARRALERGLAPLMATNVTDADLAHLDHVLREFQDAVEREDNAAAQEWHLEFHLGLLRAMHMPALELMLKPMGEVIVLSSVRPTAHPARFEFESHLPVLAALRARELELLQEAIDAHFAVLSGPAYRALRSARFHELLDHEDFVLLRGRLASRARTSEEIA